MVGNPSRKSDSGLEASRRSGSGRDAHPKVREWSRDPPGGPGVVERPNRSSWIGREALLEIWEWSGGPPGGLGVVERPSRRFGSGR